jgi:hypothetical protein
MADPIYGGEVIEEGGVAQAAADRVVAAESSPPLLVKVRAGIIQRRGQVSLGCSLSQREDSLRRPCSWSILGE